eukprot:1161090-Pelagomonas_calceolata.AAC.1
MERAFARIVAVLKCHMVPLSTFDLGRPTNYPLTAQLWLPQALQLKKKGVGWRRKGKELGWADCSLCFKGRRILSDIGEKPNDIPEGETPHNVTMYVYEGNVDLCRPGDRVTITGTYRAQV